MNKKIIITGATSGFGKAAAKQFAINGHHVIITGRRQDRLIDLKKELETFDVKVLDLCFDVQNQKEVEKAFSNLPEFWSEIDILINNAGLASGMDKIQDGDLKDWEKMIDTNVKGLLYVSKAVIPFIKKNSSGHIINIGSTSSKEVYQGGNVYCASKHAVDAISKGMRIDLLEDGIKVTQINPGMAETEFSNVRFHGDNEKADAVYKGFEPMTAEDIAEIIYYTASLPPHLCINDLVVTSTAQANSFYTVKD